MSTKLVAGTNDLTSVYPNVAAEWHPKKNGNIYPSLFLPQSNEKVWWLGTCGHEWEAMISSRTGKQGCGCPYCANKKVLKGYNDLASTNPDLMVEWDFEKNNISPFEVTKGSHKKSWWICKQGHSFESPIAGRTGQRRRGCPFCSNQKVLQGYNDLLSRSPKLAAEWHPTKNDGITPDRVLAGGHKKVWWKCANGHEWKDAIITRLTMNIGCPYCSGRYAIVGESDLLTTNPQLVAEWDFAKNDSLKPTEVKAGSHKSVWWKCKDCGHSWTAFVSDRTRGNGCPSCSRTYRTSAPEQVIYYYLSLFFPNAVNSYKPNWIGNSSEIDIYIPEKGLGIEYDGQRWHRDVEKDINKNILCEKHGIKLLRIRENGCPEFPVKWQSIIVGNPSQNLAFMEPVVLQMLSIFGIDNFTDVDIERDLPKILATYENNKKEKSLSFKYPEVARGWNYEKNDNLTPDMVTSNSNRKLWWNCQICGYEWSSTVNNRIKRGCPACSNKIVWEGHNDLATLKPKYLGEWAYDLNTGISPINITPGAEVKVWWRCKECGYTWETQPYRRKRGRGCPACVGKAVWQGHNDMQTLYPTIASEWNYDKNDGLLPNQFTAGSMKRAWWKCNNCGHEWQTGIDNRTHKGSGCPICARKNEGIKMHD